MAERKAEVRSTREAAGEAVLELAREGLDVVALSADTSKSMFINLLAGEYPERAYDVGIAEQNMVMVAAGLAAAGKTVFAASYAVFMSMRCCEQLRTFVAYPNLNVKIIAGIGGLSAGIEGVTHLATEDLGIMRCISNMAVIAPSDYTSTKMAVKAAAAHQGPVYIRVGRDATPVLFGKDYPFEIGKPVMHRRGKDILLVTNGLVTGEVLKSAELLAQMGIGAGVMEIHTLKPILDEEMVIRECLSAGRVMTVEEHNVIGGLGSAVAELLCGRGPLAFERLGLPDCYGRTGTPDELLEAFGLNCDSIVKKAREMVGDQA